MQTKQKYKQLTADEREEIAIGMAQGKKQSIIAKELNRDRSTISREIHRNSTNDIYRGHIAQRKAITSTSSRRHDKRRIDQNQGLRDYVLTKLKLRWSPEEIAKRMKQEYSDDMSMRIDMTPN